ncbi:conserved hypothetical protein [Candida dubliniensis CD36]|uniref:Uncharacterized protein n=1 Tax=Candida dubliniensis (strain CD36 / ATCC MYA-646 / CBS 7987 / NCPF 3949 / NRRL Y-17841) TaxID=573826 RepID=B9WCE9_CANDC|nr:conserved hypothetical protein [Candida dubliniensis CD36]CAX44071.1 conserved hypothetical protein [Candida dubliniensis CD36]
MASNQPIMPKINSPLGILRTSQAVASDITINIILYILIYSIIYLFRLRNYFLQLNHYFITLILLTLEILWVILYIIIRLIYLIYNTVNDSKINDYRYNTHGILRTFIIHNQFWKFDHNSNNNNNNSNNSNNLVMNSIFKHGPNIFLDIQDDLIIPNLINDGKDIIIPVGNDIDIDIDDDDNESSLASNISNSTRIKTKSNFTKWARHGQFAPSAPPPPPPLSSSASVNSLNKLKSKIKPKNNQY